MPPPPNFPSASRSFRDKVRFHLQSRFAAPLVQRLRRIAPVIASVPAGPVLVVAPHPDDETLGCGGLIALKRLRGEPVHVVFLTSGEGSLAGHPLVTPAALAARREAEASAALGVLGVAGDAVEFLRASEGGFTSAGTKTCAIVVEALTRALVRERPAVIVTPFRHDGHPDHEAAYAVTREAALRSGGQAQIWEYPVWALWLLTRAQSRRPDFRQFDKLEIGSLLPRKRQALASHTSQISPVPPWRRPTLARRFTDRLLNRSELFRRSGALP